VYLSYPPGTVGHPADLGVELPMIDLPDGRPGTLVALPQGQSTINVPSWAQDGRRLAYVSYPFAES
jgi:TolB protein